jgi:hypothetical protein
MANEWTKADVFHAMRQKANADGTVPMLQVERMFPLRTAKSRQQFSRYVEDLISDDKIIRVSRNVVLIKGIYPCGSC